MNDSNAPQPAQKSFELPMLHKGVNYRLRKREQSAEAPWYLRIARRGKDYWRCTGTNDATLAVERAGTVIDLIGQEQWQALEAMKLRRLPPVDKKQPAPADPLARFKGDINPQTGKFELPMLCEDRRLVLFKRKQKPRASWYLRMDYRGKAYWRCTGTYLSDLAVLRAKTLIQAILNQDERTLAETKLRDPLKYATLGQVFTIYKTQSPVGRATRRSNIGSLRTMVRTVRGPAFNAETLSVEELTPKFVRDFQAKVVERVRAQKLSIAAERAALARAQRSANSDWGHARSLFVIEMMTRYTDAGCNFPRGFPDFQRAPMIRGVERLQYVQPPDDRLLKTIKAARELMAEVDLAVREGRPLRPPNPGRSKKKDDAPRPLTLDLKDRMAVVFALEIGCGLRKGEIIAARGAWLGQVNGELSIALPADATKNSKPRRLRIPVEFQPYLFGYVKRREIGPEDVLVPNAPRIAKAVSQWLRQLGWTGTKTNHALRKYFGYLVAKTYGIEVAQWALDHANIKTTQQDYVGIIQADGVVVALPAPVKDEKIVALPAAG